MTPEARIATACDVLDEINAGTPAEQALTNWGRKHRFAGSKDRAALRDLVFEAIRCRGSFAWLGGGESGRALMIGRLRAQRIPLESVFTGEGYAPSVLSAQEQVQNMALSDAPDTTRLDCPVWLWEKFHDSLGIDREKVLTLLQQRAPVFLRVNLAKANVEQAMAMLENDEVEVAPHALSPTALEVLSNPRRVQSSYAYQQGFVELQDAASQALVDLLQPLKTAKVLDYCAGGGGKSLALAALGAHVTAHDALPKRMKDIAPRAKRAGVQVRIAEQPKGQFDLVLCDAPCSGSGAWRRQPEAKWALDPARLEALNEIQSAILEEAKAHVLPKGRLAYATCSLLRDENQMRVEKFLHENPDWQVSFDRQFSPLDGGDGFYLAVLERKQG